MTYEEYLAKQFQDKLEEANSRIEDLQYSVSVLRDTILELEKKLGEQKGRTEYYQKRERSAEDQLLWLADWCLRATGIDTNDVIGLPRWPKTLVEVVAKAIEDHIKINYQRIKTTLED
jgi:hypothetical protein